MVEFIAFPFSSKLKIWSFHVVVVQGLQRSVQKEVMHMQSCCFAHLTYCFFDVPVVVAVVVSKDRLSEASRPGRTRFSPHGAESRIREIFACGILGSILACHADVLFARQKAKGKLDEALRTSAGRLNASR